MTAGEGVTCGSIAVGKENIWYNFKCMNLVSLYRSLTFETIYVFVTVLYNCGIQYGAKNT